MEMKFKRDVTTNVSRYVCRKMDVIERERERKRERKIY